MVLHGQERQMKYYDIISQLEKKKYFSWYKIRFSLNKWNNGIFRNGSYYLHNSIIY